MIWRFGAALLQPLLGLKAIEANVDAQTARRDEALVLYVQTVQTAFRETHDALVANRTYRESARSPGCAPRPARARCSTRGPALRSGHSGYLEVLDSQRELLQAETLRIAAARDTQSRSSLSRRR